MKYYFALTSCALALFVVVSCQKAHDAVLRTKLAEIEFNRLNLTLDDSVRQKKFKDLAKSLSEDYPAAPPLGKDSTDRIFRPSPPVSLDGMPLSRKRSVYESPGTDIVSPEIWNNRQYLSQSYFNGGISYFLQAKKTRDNRGFTINIMDAGYMPEWAIFWTYDRLISGKGEEFFPGMNANYDFDRTVNYKGHKWAVFVPQKRLLKNRKGGTDVSVFGTYWNSRFKVTISVFDTTDRQLDNFYRLVDVEWLDKLKSPRASMPD